jgi:hypothetical protein
LDARFETGLAAATEVLRSPVSKDGASREAVEADFQAIRTELETTLGTQRFIGQCALAAADAERGGRGLETVAIPLRLLEPQRYGAAELVPALAPYWSDGDHATHEVVSRLLWQVDRSVEPVGFHDGRFDAYLDLMRDTETAATPWRAGLIDYLFDRAPWSALVAMLSLDGAAKEVLDRWSMHRDTLARAYFAARIPSSFNRAVRPAAPILRDMARDGGRWERVFVAEMLRHLPALRDGEIEELLRQQDEPLVDLRLNWPDPKWAVLEQRDKERNAQH